MKNWIVKWVDQDNGRTVFREATGEDPAHAVRKMVIGWWLPEEIEGVKFTVIEVLDVAEVSL